MSLQGAPVPGDHRYGQAPPQAPVPARPVLPGHGWAAPARRRRTVLVLEVLGVIVGGLGVLWMLSQIVLVGGTGATVLAGALAVVPLAGVLAAVAWVDRWEPEPRWLLAAALLWGAGVATVVSLVLNEAFTMAVYAGTGSTEAANVLGAVVGAPLVEESVKGLGVLAVFLLRRHYFDGPVDGIVYAATVAAGFAFVENILYFVQYGDALAQTFVMRAVQSPFAHLLFTASMGITLGIAARSPSRWAWLRLLPLGWAAAVGLHALWNGSAALGVHATVYLAFQVPLFLGVVLLVLWLRRQERNVLRARLQEYAGWFRPEEIAMLTSLGARRRARGWAAARGAGPAMADFQRSATRLALDRERAVTGRRHLRRAQDEGALLARVADSRARLALAARD